MIYNHTVEEINTNIESAWKQLLKISSTEKKYLAYPDCSGIEVSTNHEGTIFRNIQQVNGNVEENLNIIPNFYRVNAIMHNNPYYQGEITYQLIKPSQSYLSENNCSLIIILAWRMHPGVFAAPKIDKQGYVEQLGKNIKEIIENS